jgi:tripartite-type tricarboxylate transporter receptor subunit TctC
MSHARRRFLHLVSGAVVLPAVSRIARAETYPSRPVRFIVGFAPAGGNDIVARLIGQWLSERLGQTFIIENRSGAGTNIATEAVVNAPPDGYTLVLVGVPNASNATLYSNLKFNFIRDIAEAARQLATRKTWRKPCTPPSANRDSLATLWAGFRRRAGDGAPDAVNEPKTLQNP